MCYGTLRSIAITELQTLSLVQTVSLAALLCTSFKKHVAHAFPKTQLGKRLSGSGLPHARARVCVRNALCLGWAAAL